jgi:hypothetical protein
VQTAGLFEIAPHNAGLSGLFGGNRQTDVDKFNQGLIVLFIARNTSSEMLVCAGP